MNWLVDLIDRLLAWVPRPTLLDPNEAGLRISHKKRRLLEGGRLYWYVPLLQEIKTFPVVEQTADLPPQTLMTANKKALTVSGILAYEVRDIETLLTKTHDIDDIVLDIGRAAIAEVIMGVTLQHLVDELQDGTLAHALTLKTRARLRRYGIHVLRAALNEACPCSVVRLVGSSKAAPLPYSATSAESGS